jgi:hypothetical protein
VFRKALQQAAMAAIVGQSTGSRLSLIRLNKPMEMRELFHIPASHSSTFGRDLQTS